MKREDCFQLGYITRAHGMRGDVYAHFDVDDPQKYGKLESVFVEINNELVPFFIDRIRFRDKGTLITFADCRDLEAATALKSCKLFLSLRHLPSLDSDQFYYHDVIGYTVVDSDRGPLGNVERFYEREGQDLLAMLYRGQEVLIPVTHDIIGVADHESRELYVSLPEGLVDIYL